MRHLLLATALLLLVAPAASACAGADAHPSRMTAKKTRSAVVCLINKQRRAHGLKALKRNRRLARAGARHAADMVARSYFAHETPEGVTPRVRAAAYIPDFGPWSVGENLAWGAAGKASPRSTVRRWMNSPTHRANVLQPRFREIGVGVVAGAPGRSSASAYTYAAEFGGR